MLRYFAKILEAMGAPAPPSTQHFSIGMFASRGMPVPRKYWRNIQRVMDALEVLHEYLGGPAINVNSGWRSLAHNNSVGGKKRSKHLTGMAADIKVVGYRPKAVADAIERLMSMGAIAQGGLGRYPRFTHIDVRGRRARWGSN